MSTTQVIMLGTGTPNADAERVSTGIAIVVDDLPYLIDCGHGVIQRVVEAKKRDLIKWDTTDLTLIFVTHLHADHVVGLPDLMFTPWIHGRKRAIKAFGPEQLQQMVWYLQLAFDENIREHTTAHPFTEDGYRIDVTAVKDGQFYQDEVVKVSALTANHGELSAFSYKFVTPNKTIVISGDTKPVPGFVEWAKGCDILIHEVYSAANLKNRTAEWQAYHTRCHTSTTELADLAKQIQPKLLVLSHQLFWGATPEELVKEITATYDGKVVSANDLDVY